MAQVSRSQQRITETRFEFLALSDQTPIAAGYQVSEPAHEDFSLFFKYIIKKKTMQNCMLIN